MQQIPILMYHNIGSPPAGARLRSLYVRASAFSRQMTLLRLLGYRGLSMSRIMPYLRGEKSGRVVAITFDDGYVDTLEQALPILQKNGFSATCYVVSEGVGGYNDWDSDALGVKKPLMSASQLGQWADAGMEIGAHSRTHPFLTKCSDNELLQETEGCKKELEDTIGKEVTQFCYPSGDFNDRVVAAVHKAGYVAATTTRRGRAKAGDDLFRLPRVLVGGHNYLPQFLVKLITRYEDRRG